MSRFMINSCGRQLQASLDYAHLLVFIVTHNPFSSNNLLPTNRIRQHGWNSTSTIKSQDRAISILLMDSLMHTLMKQVVMLERSHVAKN